MRTQKEAPDGQGPMTNRMLRAALEYASQGVAVLPLDGKAPMGHLVPNGLHDATTDPDIIKSWFDREPEANIGTVPPNGWAILDVDPREGGKATILNLVNGHRLGSLVARTGRGDGGQHIWLREAPDRLPGKLGKGVDVKKAGKGYVVAPPSIHPDTGKPYTWKGSFDLNQVRAWPKWLQVQEKAPARDQGTSDLTKNQVKQILKRIPADDYDDWLRVGMALKSGFGDKALPLWVKWSQTAPDAASAEDCKKKWRSFKGSGVSTGTLVSMAGLTHPPPRSAQDDFDDDLPMPEKKEVQAISMVQLSTVTPTEIPWAWKGYLAYGSLHCIAGEPSAGKSSFVAGLVAKITRGHHWPDGTEMAEPQNVLMVNGEESLQATIVPRLINCGADLKRISVVREEKHPFSLQDDVERVDKALEEDPSIRFVIVDPIGSYMHGKKRKEMDSWKDNDVREVLHPWATLSQKRNICFIFVAHFGKAKTMKAMHQVMGSQAFIALARLGMACIRATHYAGDENARAFGAIKQNLGRMRPPLLYYINTVGDDPDAAPIVDFGGRIQGVGNLDELIEYEQEARKIESKPDGLPHRILDVVRAKPGLSMKEVADKVGIPNTSEGFQNAVHKLMDMGEMVAHRRTGPAKYLYLAADDTLIE